LTASAQASTGAALPGGIERKPIRTLVVCDEDGIDDVIVPRLLAATYDADMVTFIQVRDGLLSLPDDVALVERAVRKERFGLVWIDSASSYLSDGLNVNRDQDVRKALMPLAKVAHDQRATMLATWHVNKGTEAAAGHRVTGSTAIRNVARSLLIAGELPEDLGEGYGIIREKGNYAGRTPGRSYVIQDDSRTHRVGNGRRRLDAAKLVWTGELPDLVPDDLLPRKRKRGAAGRPADERIIASNFLLDELDDGPMPQKLLLKKAEDEGIAERTLKRAKRALKVLSVKRGESWYWELSEETRALVRKAEDMVKGANIANT
jgi:AAA domain